MYYASIYTYVYMYTYIYIYIDRYNLRCRVEEGAHPGLQLRAAQDPEGGLLLLLLLLAVRFVVGY